MKKPLLTAALLSLALTLGSCTQSSDSAEGTDPEATESTPAAIDAESVAQESEQPPSPGIPTQSATGINLQFGQTHIYDDGLALTISQPVEFESNTAIGDNKGGEHTVYFAVTIVNQTPDELRFASTLNVQSAGIKGGIIFRETSQDLRMPPTLLIPVGASAHFKAGYFVTDPADLTVSLSPAPGYTTVVYRA